MSYMGKKKKNCLFHVDGFEEWMDQFCSDSYSNFSFPNQIYIDLCETEEEYILETDVQNVTEQNVLIKKLETGLAICILHKNISLQRTIPLPTTIIYKKMLACLENGFLAIHISKNEVADKHEKKVLFSN
ncbi:Hsp20/alpha crystallin family protein [Bacillus thuringiensis]|uniref:Hsp20/alpha crystallin family protein n=2 Tax=Bacillus thuringiensis TaxID=1428 RepID=A0AB36TZJ5_BACTU|nr:Hsp20/alpha crystallin family protein [Bacillus thuringiensis]PEE62511.1 Hsp20/alpha crystallin family protein [Bacillus thuringiensis]PEE70472.1 Hsp20/alpha crystallin family protein [Bacillus thuringiensis]PEE85878.1 Hsp20/alpha crystallin family protein [Bacillus thuringiensis]PEV94054.1 Hsp20/alpha crystallin family protein [Bacillus thuringiensis]